MSEPDINAVSLTRKGPTLIATDIRADEMLRMVPDGREVLVTLRRARHPRHHRWFFALLRKVRENTDDRWKNEKHLLEAVKMEVGHYDVVPAFGRGTITVANSINWSAMGQLEFKIFVERVLDAIQMKLGLDSQELMREVNAEQGFNPMQVPNAND